MKIGILTFGRPKSREDQPPYEVRRLVEAARERGHEARIFCEPFFAFRESNGRFEIFYDNEPMPPVDVFIARMKFTEEPSLHLVTVDMLTAAGCRIVNSGAGSISTVKNKLTRKLLLARAGLPTPRSSVVRAPETIMSEAMAIGFPLIVKIPNGSWGRGVFLAENLETLSPIVDYLTVNQKIPVLVEEFIKESKGRDIRVFVAGEKIIAAMEREAKTGEIRSNIHAGGAGQPVELTEAEKELALRAARALNLEIAGVDIIRSARGPLVLEVNANPGFEGLEQATGVDVAGGIIDFVTKLCYETTKNYETTKVSDISPS